MDDPRAAQSQRQKTALKIAARRLRRAIARLSQQSEFV
jgi:hypothetical protein